MHFRVQVKCEDKLITTLRDILPDKPTSLRILIIGKRPAPTSVDRGHYLQGQHGKNFWKKLRECGLLNVPSGMYEDQVLLTHRYGITDIVKTPAKAGVEPSDAEYEKGIDRVNRIIEKYSPSIALFIYKGALDTWLKLEWGRKSKSEYGLNEDLEPFFGRKVFVFPMPGTPCKRGEADQAMQALTKAMSN